MYDQVCNSVSYPPPSCLDAGYERKAIDDGWAFDPEDLFPENRAYYTDKRKQVAPCRNHGSLDPNVETVKELLTERSRIGFKKYGTLTNRGDLSTLEWLQHLQEELMDASVYIEVLKGKLHGNPQ
jgi:hypothetical protein